MTQVLNEGPFKLYNNDTLLNDDNIVTDNGFPVVTNLHDKGVCGPCLTGLCMLTEYLPPEAQGGLVGFVGNMYGKLFHSATGRHATADKESNGCTTCYEDE